MKKIKDFFRSFKKHWFIIAIIIFAILRILLVDNIPIVAFPSQVYDDDLMLKLAENIRAGNWLGEYNSDTLVKGPFFPFLLAMINYLGISYIHAMSLCYTLSCLYFVYTIKDLLKSKVSLFVIYLLLLFNPVSYAFWTLQRVYRNGITLAQVLLIIGSMFAVYQRRDGKIKNMLPFAIVGGITLATLWLTREDGIWILPFIITVIMITIVSMIVKSRNEDKKIQLAKTILTKIVIVLLPMILLYTSLNIIRGINQHYYDVNIYNEISDGYFGKVIKIMYSVKTDEDIEYVTVTRKKLKLLYEQSETLNSIKDELEASVSAWDGADRKPGDGQVEDGWFWWALKGAVYEKGMYQNAKTANDFYKKIYDEINQAIKEGKLETQISMPSNLMSPWKSEYLTKLPIEMAKTSWYIANFNEVETVNRESEPGARRYEAFTQNIAIHTTQEAGTPDIVAHYTNRYVRRLNRISKIYQTLGVAITVLSLVAYITITIRLIRTKDRKSVIDVWLLLTGIGCSLIVLIAGVSYNQITACFSRYYMYLSGAYPLLISFWGISICSVAEWLKKKIEERNHENIQGKAEK